jgi:hypothetical protein
MNNPSPVTIMNSVRPMRKKWGGRKRRVGSLFPFNRSEKTPDPFPYIATTAGWWTAELGRQPWLIYGLFRTAQGSSAQVAAGDVVFTTLGFAGLYLALGTLFLFQVLNEISRGPRGKPPALAEAPVQAAPAPAPWTGSQLVGAADGRGATPPH